MTPLLCRTKRLHCQWRQYEVPYVIRVLAESACNRDGVMPVTRPALLGYSKLVSSGRASWEASMKQWMVLH
jgi:hypothetical protein